MGAPRITALCDGNALALSSGKRYSPLSYHRIVALGHLQATVVGTAGLWGCMDDFMSTSFLPPEALPMGAWNNMVEEQN